MREQGSRWLLYVVTHTTPHIQHTHRVREGSLWIYITPIIVGATVAVGIRDSAEECRMGQ